MLFTTSLLFLACNPPVPENFIGYDFLKNFDKAVIYPSKYKVFKYQNWQKSTEGRDAMVIGVYGGIIFSLKPEETGDYLYFGLRLRIPDTTNAQCMIIVSTLTDRDTVYNRFLDSTNPNHRNWIDDFVNMSYYKNKHIAIEFTVYNKGIDAWVEWSSPILLKER